MTYLDPPATGANAMDAITSVETRVARVPLDVPIAFSGRTVAQREYCLVRVTTANGRYGIGFCYAGHTGGELVAGFVREVLGPMLVGQDPYCVQMLWDRMYREALLHGRTGSAMRALSAIDIAVWDHNSRSCQLPLWRYLGSCEPQRVRAYASGGYYADGKGVEDLAKEMRGYVDQGFTAVKMKVGRASAREDEVRIAATRAEVGPDVLLMLDANNAWSDATTALRALRLWERHDPYWIEEPFLPDDIDNHVRLSSATGIPVATGELEAGRWRHKELIDRGAATIIQTDAAVCGGITEFRRIVGLVEGHGLTMAPHWFHDLHCHLVASASCGRFVEYFGGNDVLNFGRLIDRQVVVQDGFIILPLGPGLGFDFDSASLDRFSPRGWS